MSTTSHSLLLTDADPPAFRVERAAGRSPYVLACDHASRLLPRQLGTLGLVEEALASHVAWDIGIAPVAAALAQQLDACCVLQNYSRLVIDANRPLSSPQSIVTLSERTEIPGNHALSGDAVLCRQREIFEPYHARIDVELERRATEGVPSVFCSLHSFTPSYLGVARPWHAAVLYDRDTRLAHALRDELRKDPQLVIGDNQPYSVSDGTDYTVIAHAERRGIPYLEIEIRQDLIAEPAGQASWARRLAQLLPPLLERVAPVIPRSPS